MKGYNAFLLIIFFAGLLFFGLFLIKKPTSGLSELRQDLDEKIKVLDNIVMQEPVTLESTQTAQIGPIQKKSYSEPPKIHLDITKDYKVILKTTNGQLKLDLFENKTPVTVNNFVFLANEGFYNGTKFHRIIRDFMIQGGDPNGDGTGGPGYTFNDEPFEGEYTPGVLAMANAGPNTNGSQFFIMTKANPLPKNYVIFGVIDDAKSMNVLMDIANTTVKKGPSGEESLPINDVVITSVDVLTE